MAPPMGYTNEITVNISSVYLIPRELPTKLKISTKVFSNGRFLSMCDKQQQQLKESIDELDSRDEQQLEPRRSCRIPKKNRRFIEL